MTKAHPRPKRHHFIPRLHLQHFAGQDPKGQVWTFDKNTGASRSAVPEETAVQTHFYSIEQDDGTYDTSAEEFLAASESNAAPVYEDLIQGRIPSKDAKQRNDFALFLSLMLLRTPAMRRDVADFIGRNIQIMNHAYVASDEAFDTLMLEVEQDNGESIQADTKQKIRKILMDSDNYKISIRKEATFMSFEVADTLVPILSAMSWLILRPRHGFFVTSDNPVVRQVDPKTHHPMYGDHGFINKTAQVTFPLTPQAMLFMARQDNLLPDTSIEREVVEQLNESRAYFADQFLYAHIDSKPVKRLAAKFKGSRPQLTTQGFGPGKFATTEIPRRWNQRPSSS